MNKKYISTRSDHYNHTASQAIIQGLAPDGGLYVPAFIHDIHVDIHEFMGLCYGDMAKKIFALFLDDFTEEQIDQCVNDAYYTGLFEHEEPVSVVKVADRYVLELFHGPTCAFKDMALTILPRLMTTAIKNTGEDKDIVILTATSGDTGKAALAGFADVPHIGIVVYYPKDGVSTIQEKQMLTQTGDNTCVIGVRGDFDDTQNGVKTIFGDKAFADELAARNIILSSANSINIGRLLPQIVYYFYSYVKLVEAEAVTLGDPINFVVPTGNFGDILAGYYATLIGLPVRHLICASNSNKILTDFFETGDYDRNRPFYKTMSPSMDILISSNLERLLYDLTNDSQKVAALMASLNDTGAYQCDADLLNKAKALFAAGTTDEPDTMAEIRKIYEDTHYLMDPHTAVASHVYTEYKNATGDDTPTVVLSTASPFKFGNNIYRSIFGEIPEGVDDYDVLERLAQQTGTKIPKPLANLKSKENRHDCVCDKREMIDTVRSFIARYES